MQILDLDNDYNDYYFSSVSVTDAVFMCLQKPSLLQIVFNVYGQAPRTVKQVLFCLLC